jgi:DNA-binding MarR family transcriptional regulator
MPPRTRSTSRRGPRQPAEFAALYDSEPSDDPTHAWREERFRAWQSRDPAEVARGFRLLNERPFEDQNVLDHLVVYQALLHPGERSSDLARRTGAAEGFVLLSLQRLDALGVMTPHLRGNRNPRWYVVGTEPWVQRPPRGQTAVPAEEAERPASLDLATLAADRVYGGIRDYVQAHPGLSTRRLPAELRVNTELLRNLLENGRAAGVFRTATMSGSRVVRWYPVEASYVEVYQGTPSTEAQDEEEEPTIVVDQAHESLMQDRVLATLRLEGQLTARQVADRLGLSQPVVVPWLRELLRMGRVTREPIEGHPGRYRYNVRRAAREGYATVVNGPSEIEARLAAEAERRLAEEAEADEAEGDTRNDVLAHVRAHPGHTTAMIVRALGDQGDVRGALKFLGKSGRVTGQRSPSGRTIVWYPGKDVRPTRYQRDPLEGV